MYFHVSIRLIKLNNGLVLQRRNPRQVVGAYPSVKFGRGGTKIINPPNQREETPREGDFSHVLWGSENTTICFPPYGFTDTCPPLFITWPLNPPSLLETGNLQVAIEA